MSTGDFWLWTIFFAILSYFLTRVFCCHNNYQEEVYIHIVPDKKMYSIQTNKIDLENV